MSAALLPPARLGLATVLVAIASLLAVLAGAAGLGLVKLARGTEGGNRLAFVQLVGEDAAGRQANLVEWLRARPDVANARVVPPQQLEGELKPWLGPVADDLALPPLIELTLRNGSDSAWLAAALARISPDARFSLQSDLAPLAQLTGALQATALAIVLLALALTAAVATLAVRTGFAAQRATLAILQTVGATDDQLARLFERRLVRDAAVGAAIGGLGGLLLAWALGARLAAIQTGLAIPVALGWWWLVLLALPALIVALTGLAARLTAATEARRLAW